MLHDMVLGRYAEGENEKLSETSKVKKNKHGEVRGTMEERQVCVDRSWK